MNDFWALVITFGLALSWLRLVDFGVARGWLGSQLSRKIIHIGTGPLFVLCWLLFSPAPSARWLAALVPFAITLQFALVGLGLMKDEAAVQAMSRSGDRREILRGPLFYGIIFVALTLIFWLDSPVGIVALMLLCGGDGLADIWGRRLPLLRLPWNPNKSLGGTLGMLLGSWTLAALVLAAYVAAGAFPGPWSAYLPALTIIALAATAVESLPMHDVDNLTVAATGVLLGLLLF